jgi:hypothetical protein
MDSLNLKRESIKTPRLVNKETLLEYKKSIEHPKSNVWISKKNLIFLTLLVIFLCLFIGGAKYGYLSEPPQIVGHYS